MPHDKNLALNPGHHGGKTATNHLSYSKADMLHDCLSNYGIKYQLKILYIL
jgi:hypothetical protein